LSLAEKLRLTALSHQRLVGPETVVAGGVVSILTLQL